MTLNASIIAPGREGSQLGGADTPRPAGDFRNCRPWHYCRERDLSRQQYLPVMIEELRLSRPVVKGVNWVAPPKLVSTKTANGGGEGQPLAA